MPPKVTVLMAVYNGQRHIRETINSVLTQTYPDFDFLIVNDGSTDDTEEIVRSYSDERIRLINNDKNLGHSTSLNKGIDLARGEYIARIDADDIALPARLEEQVKFMDENPEVGISGTWFRVMGTDFVQKNPVSHKDIYAEMFFDSPLGHPTTILRKALLDKHDLRYSPAFRNCEDYDLWSRAIDCFHFANLDKVLLEYRKHENQMTSNISHGFLLNQAKVRIAMLKKLVKNPTNNEVQLHLSLIVRNIDWEKLGEYINWINKIHNELLDERLSRFFMDLFYFGKKNNLKVYNIFKKSVYYKRVKLRERLVFFCKCMINYSG